MRIKWNIGGFRTLRAAPGVRADLEARAKRVQEAATASGNGGQYVVYSQQGRAAPQGRWRTSVTTADPHAMAHEAKHGGATLISALEAGR
ncbi:hypothetical protein D5S18_02995 [Nocardia panacis]|uniref:Uncharacterized protein n=1 Tax=Nocardia panacis TaxID=2340916 RepID=A0A3A4K398_9NOCA|nr:hypothetical protein [Nocardia panacis]RJO79313.1 hypothetical protein D5S18_02995 [Nocardia panacis]